jgi:hypothetical protein
VGGIVVCIFRVHAIGIESIKFRFILQTGC